jgi:hypothetical protein
MSLIVGCASWQSPSLYLSHWDLKQPEVSDFDLCASSGCEEISNLGYTEEEWDSIRAIFEPTPKNAAEERARILTAVGAMEQINGEKNGTAGDAPRNRRHLGTGAQLDCIAEAANTTVALLLLKKEGLLRFHTVGYPQHRGFFQIRLPHNAASIYETGTENHFVVDSWFYKNGEPPISVPVSQWRGGYDPDKEIPVQEEPKLKQTGFKARKL